MTYLRGIQANDSASIDAFGRWRTSEPGNRLDVEFLYNKQPDYFDEVTNGASASVTHNTTTRDLTLTVGSTTNGEYAGMYSYPVPYTPGCSQQIELTGVLDLANIGGGTAQIFLRSSITGSAVETTIDQSSWLSNTSGVNWDYGHIFGIDFQSLKMGRIRYFLNQAGVTNYIGAITNDNVRNSGYWQLPNLPAYFRIYNDATYTYMELGYGDTANAVGFRYRILANASATMKANCVTVKSEGGSALKDMVGLPRTINTGVTTRTVSTTTLPVISIRSNTTFNSLANLILAIPKDVSFQINESILLTIRQGGTLTGASWASVDATNSSMQYDVSATAISGGRILHSDYVYASTTGPATVQSVTSAAKLLGKSPVWARQGSETGIFTVCMIRTGGTNASVLAGIDWEEFR